MLDLLLHVEDFSRHQLLGFGQQVHVRRPEFLLNPIDFINFVDIVLILLLPNKLLQLLNLSGQPPAVLNT